MNRKIKMMLLTAAVVPQMFAVNVIEIKANGKNKQKMIDGSTIDGSIWAAKGEKQNVEFVFDKKEVVARIRIYPGCRGYAPLPSTEAGPRDLIVWGKKDGKFVKLLDKVVTLPRDPQKGSEFFCDIDLAGDAVSAVRLEILNSQDRGFRINSPKKPIAGPEEREVKIREVKFFSTAEVEAEKKAIYAKFSLAAALLKKYDNFIASNTDVSKIIKDFYGRRFEDLRKELAKGINAERIIKDAEYLEKQVVPYMSLKNNYKGDKPAFTVRVLNSVKPGTPIEFPMHFGIFEKLTGQKLSVYNVQVEAIVRGKYRQIRSSLDSLTPSRGKLYWNSVKDASEYLIILNFPTVGETPLMKSVIGNGDQLMVNNISKGSMSWRTWNIRSGDIFNEGKDAFITGMWTDYAHIYRNLGTKEKPSFHEGAHYYALDPYDQKIGTTNHHGLAFSLVEVADLSGDGKLDIVLSRSYNNTPIFAENVSPDSNSLDFNHPVEISTLPSGYRYSYGDLDGDKIADAVGISINTKNGKILLCFGKGLGLDRNGTPVFERLQDMDLKLPNSTETSRSHLGIFPTVCVTDLNNDGLLDLGFAIPANFYVSFNEGTAKNFKFTKVKQVMHENGKPVQDLTFNFPNVGWFDVNGDNIKDFFTRETDWTYLSKGDVTTVADKKSGTGGWVEQQLKLDAYYFALGNFTIEDFDNDGELEFCQQTFHNTLQLFRYKDGMFNRVKVFPFDKYDFQRFGCPDPGEFSGPYSQITMFDFDGDGLKDVLVNNEHNWRMGYYSLYLNNGKTDLHPEIQIAPKKETRHLKLVNSPKGKALTVNPDTILDYLSFECQKLVNNKAGAIEFTFAADSNDIPKVGRTFFSSWFWNRKQYNNNQLYDIYFKTKSMAKYLEKIGPFALLQMPDGKIRCQLGTTFCESAPVKLNKGEYHKFEVKWDAKGVKVIMDGKEIASSNAQVPAFAERLHLGSMVWMAVQHAREYPTRRNAHPVDFSTPACGYFENFKLFNADGKESLTLDFENNFGILKNRAVPVYRCAPAVIENFKDGKPALIVQCDDMYRTEIPGNPKARVYIIPFTQVKGKAPVFEEAIPLNLTDGRPFIGNSRNVIALHDWDKDGDLDVIFATEHTDNEKHNDGVELFINDGKWNFTRAHHPIFKKLNSMLSAHHDVKAQFVNLTGSEDPDIVVWTDPGIRVFSRNYLTQDAPIVAGGTVIGRKDDTYYDVDFNAANGKMPNSVGFTSQGYRGDDPALAGYSGIKEADGKKVLVLDHSSDTSKWNNYRYFAPDAEWKSLTIDLKFRLTGNTEKHQFNICAVFKDTMRKHKTSFITVDWSKNMLQVAGLKFDVKCDNEFRAFRVVIDRAKNTYKVYDMDNGGKEVGSFVLMTGTPQHKPCVLSFGDGSSDVEGRVELEYFKVVFDRTYYPQIKK